MPHHVVTVENDTIPGTSKTSLREQPEFIWKLILGSHRQCIYDGGIEADAKDLMTGHDYPGRRTMDARQW